MRLTAIVTATELQSTQNYLSTLYKDLAYPVIKREVENTFGEENYRIREEIDICRRLIKDYFGVGKKRVRQPRELSEIFEEED